MYACSCDVAQEGEVLLDPVDTVRSLFKQYYLHQQVGEWRANTPLLTDALRMLSREQAELVAEEIWAQRNHRGIENLLGQLSTSVPQSVASLCMQFIEDKCFLPGWLYLGAQPSVTARLLLLLGDPAYREYRNLILFCLGWIGDDLVQARFHSWREQPPSWQSDIYNAPEEYPLEAGWEVTATGKRRNLYHTSCYELTAVSVSGWTGSSNVAPITTSLYHEDHCRWCGRPLVTAWDIDLREPRCGSIVDDGSRLRIAECLWCSAYATIFTDIDLDGGSVWSAANGSKPYTLNRIADDGNMPPVESHCLAIGSLRRTPYEAVGRFSLSETGISQLGGLPEWLQKVAYPICPSCSRHMLCIGQIAWDEIYQDGMGISYGFLCLDCGKAASIFQQP